MRHDFLAVCWDSTRALRVVHVLFDQRSRLRQARELLAETVDRLLLSIERLPNFGHPRDPEARDLRLRRLVRLAILQDEIQHEACENDEQAQYELVEDAENQLLVEVSTAVA